MGGTSYLALRTRSGSPHRRTTNERRPKARNPRPSVKEVKKRDMEKDWKNVGGMIGKRATKRGARKTGIVVGGMGGK